MIRPFFRGLFFYTVIGLLFYGSLKCSKLYDEYNAAEIRDVKLMEAWSYLSGTKQSLSEHWTGYFIDVKSGNSFEYELGGRQYTQFKNTGGTVEMKLELEREYWDKTPNPKSNAAYLGKGVLLILALVLLIHRWFFTD